MERFATGVPLYIQIAESLLNQIESGELSPGDRLPSERKLSEALGVNRLTLRRALSRLEAQGAVIRQHGKGNFVAEPKIERRAGRLVSFTTGMQRRGYTPGAKVITFERRPAEVTIADGLEVPVSTLIYYVRRLRSINQEPVMLEELWLPVHLFPGFERYDLTSRSVYEIMKTEYGIAMGRARRTMEPVVATEYEAELLGVETGAPLMLERRIGFDQDERLIEYGKDLYRGDRFRFVTEDALWEP